MLLRGCTLVGSLHTKCEAFCCLGRSVGMSPKNSLKYKPSEIEFGGNFQFP